MRKWLGHIYVPGSLAPRVDDFLRDTLSPLLNFHRPCLFSVDATSATGRVRKRYPQAQVATPYDRLRSLPGTEGFLSLHRRSNRSVCLYAASTLFCTT